MGKDRKIFLTNCKLRASGKCMHVAKSGGDTSGAKHTICRLEEIRLRRRTVIPAEIPYYAKPPICIGSGRKIPSVQGSPDIACTGIGRERELGAHERVAGKYLDFGCVLRLRNQPHRKNNHQYTR